MKIYKYNIAIYGDYDSELKNNILFSSRPEIKHWEDLRTKLNKDNISFNSFDICKKNGVQPDILIVCELPKKNILEMLDLKVTKLILLLREGSTFHPNFYEIKNHNIYDYVLTWKNKLVDNIKYFNFF